MVIDDQLKCVKLIRFIGNATVAAFAAKQMDIDLKQIAKEASDFNRQQLRTNVETK